MVENQALKILHKQFGKRLQEQVSMQKYSTARVGGNASWFLTVKNLEELSMAVILCWEYDIKFFLLGAGSNVLFSDAGFDGLVILNQAKHNKIYEEGGRHYISAESGAGLGLVARKAALAGLSGLEWANTVPGTVGGAVYGNAGAFGSDIKSTLLLAEILQHGKGKSIWKNEDFQFSYRSSRLKRQQTKGIILSATFKCQPDDPEKIKERMNSNSEYRRKTQPPGASMGSMFKNPPGDYAGRLIESAGLKGFSIGGVKISDVHANFFVNSNDASANDYFQLSQHVQKIVKQEFDVDLELEVEMVGFNNDTSRNHDISRKAS